MMKKIFAVILALAMLLPAVLSVGTVAGAEEYTVKPYYGLGWSDINRIKFPNLEGFYGGSINAKDGVVTVSSGDAKKDAAALKKLTDKLPDGMRHLHFYTPSKAFAAAPEDVVYLDKGVDQLKEQFTAFIKEYHAIGGKLDGIVVDVEYLPMYSWYIYSREYYKSSKVNNTQIYNQIVNHPKYATEIRPLLVERGFPFYENVGGVKSEIYSIWPYLSGTEAKKYAGAGAIWDTVMSIRMAEYLNESMYEPLIKYYPDAIFSDYQVDDTAAWEKSLSDAGGVRGYYGGNGMKAGNASNYNTYASRPNNNFYKDSKGNYLYTNPVAYNKADYEDDPYNMFLFDANKFKQMYAATDTKKITAWIAEYDYNVKAGSVSNTPYYTETIYHIGMLNPEPFLVYVYDHEDKFMNPNGSVNTTEYNKRMQVISEILYELTRVAGYSDRTPIETPSNWNDGFVLSGMYTGGRNLWRITPDTTDGTTLEAFKIKDKAPTFSINGTTIVFPQGRIIEDGEISVVGTAGYWVETPKNVQPVITRDADRYSENPSLVEDFSGYANGTVFNTAKARPAQTWNVTSTSNLVIQSGALSITGTATLSNNKLPKNITAADSYAKQQAWEVSFTIPTAMNSGANVKLLTAGGDGGIKIEGNKVYIDRSGSYRVLDGVTLSTGVKYTVKREMNFTVNGAYTCTYSIYANGTLLKQEANVPIRSNIAVPVETIGISCTGLTTRVLIDDYKLYPTGLAKDLEVYNAENGLRLDSTAKNDEASVVYRLSWMNATNAGQKVNVKAAYYSSTGALLSTPVTVKTVEMAPGADNVEIGFVQNNAGGKVVIYLEDAGAYTPGALPNYDNGDFNWVAGQPGTKPTTPEPTTPEPTTPDPSEPEPTMPGPGPRPEEPTEVPPTAPTDAPITDPSATDVPGTEPSVTPTDVPTTVPGGATETTPGTGATEATESPDSDVTPEPGVKKGMSGGTVVLIVVGVLVLAGAGVGAYFFFIKKKP